MNLAMMLSLPLWAGAPAAPAPGVGLAAPAVVTATAVDAFSDLVQSFEEATSAWKQKLKDTDDLRERAKLRDEAPAKTYWSRFEAMADGGEGRALLWMSDNAKNAGTKRSELPALKLRLYTALADKHVAEPWFGDVINAIAREKRTISDEERAGLLTGVMKSEKAGTDTRAHATFALASHMTKSKDEATVARGKELLKSLVKDYPDTKWAIEARAASITAEDLLPGKPAPDFVGKTIDGHEFKLSDYKGKVVLVDFYGFW